MEWINNVEEACLFIEDTLNIQVYTDEVGNEVDAEKQMDILGCQEEGDDEDPAFTDLNPEGLFDQPCMDTLGNKLCKQLKLEQMEVLVEKTKRLDDDQRKVLDIAIKFARETIIASKSSSSLSSPSKFIVTGGAGAGKSTLIDVMCQWLHRILIKPGDDPESPYILKTATTGAASVLIDGITLHSAMGFDFSNKHTSLTDKKRESRREQMKNTKVIIIDEFSLW